MGERGPPPGYRKGAPKTPGSGRKKGSLNKTAADVRALASQYTDRAMQRIAEIMNDPKAPIPSALAASIHIIDRAVGRPMVPVEQKVEGAPSFVVVAPAVASSQDEWLEQVRAEEAAAAITRN
jgi:hypothetical protein